MSKPLTNEQIWGVPDEDLPVTETKDFFEPLLYDNDHEESKAAEINQVTIKSD